MTGHQPATLAARARRSATRHERLGAAREARGAQEGNGVGHPAILARAWALKESSRPKAQIDFILFNYGRNPGVQIDFNLFISVEIDCIRFGAPLLLVSDATLLAEFTNPAA
jgi:hypothetical protein